MSRLNQVTDSIFLRKAAILSAGNGAAQAVDVLTVPLLARLFSPQAFGSYGVFLAMGAIVAVFTTWRYERGLVVSRSECERRALFALIVVLSSVLTGAIVLLAALWPRQVFPDSTIVWVVGEWGAWLALYLGLGGVMTGYEFLALKQKEFRVLGVSRFGGAASLAALKIFFGTAGHGAAVGLPLSTVLSRSLVVSWLAWKARIRGWFGNCTGIPSWCAIRVAARRNAEFPREMTWSSLFNSATGHVPVLMIGLFFSTAAAGQFFMAHRIMARPMALLISSIADTTLQEAAESALHGVKAVYLRRARKLALLAVPAFLLAFMLAPVVVPLFLGWEWGEAGRLVQYLIPGLFVQFVLTPFSALFVVLREQRLYLCWAAARLVLVSTGLFAGGLAGGVAGAALGYSLATGISFVVQHLLLLRSFRLRMEMPGDQEGSNGL